MSQIESYEQRLEGNLYLVSGVTGTPTDEQIAKSGFEVLIPLLVELLSVLITSCINRFKPDDVAESIHRMGPLQRASLKRAIRRDPDIPKEDRQRVFDAAYKTNTETPVDDLKELVAEVKAEPVPDVSLW